MVETMDIDKWSTYNAIIQRATLNSIKAITFTYHLMMKFHVGENHVDKVHKDQAFARECYVVATKVEGKALMISTINQLEQDYQVEQTSLMIGELDP